MPGDYFDKLQKQSYKDYILEIENKEIEEKIFRKIRKDLRVITLDLKKIHLQLEGASRGKKIDRKAIKIRWVRITEEVKELVYLEKELERSELKATSGMHQAIRDQISVVRQVFRDIKELGKI